MKTFILLAIVMTQTPQDVSTHDYVVDYGLTYEDCVSAQSAARQSAVPVDQNGIRVSTTFACTSES
ncbi:hypothetical protein FHV99_004651 [Ochrobactrum sp. P20RRXII]|nr:hypothetical protein [Ochrobactrum sp. P20RRXII]NIH77399.1 hypothetical protein [Ochrobactrum sp. P20RRXII]